MATIIAPIQEITTPLAIRSSSDVSTFNSRAERNLTELRQMTLDFNNNVIPNINALINEIDPLLQNLSTIILTSQNIPILLNVNSRLPQIETVSTYIADVRTVAADILNVRAVSSSISSVNSVYDNLSNISQVVLNMAAITAAPTHAQSASTSAAAAQQSATQAQQSATASSVSATQSANSETTALAAEDNIITIQQAIEQMHGSLLQGATPEATPNTPILRDGTAQAKVSAPTHDLHITNRQYVTDAISLAISSVAGGLKTPEVIDLESNLPNAQTVPNGTYYIINEMDISRPGFTGEAWKNDSVSTTSWLITIDRMQTADGTNIVLDTQGRLNLSTTIQNTIAKVNTTGPVQTAIDSGMWQNSSKYLGTSTPSSALGVNGDFYFMYV